MEKGIRSSRTQRRILQLYILRPTLFFIFSDILRQFVEFVNNNNHHHHPPHILLLLWPSSSYSHQKNSQQLEWHRPRTLLRMAVRSYSSDYSHLAFPIRGRIYTFGDKSPSFILTQIGYTLLFASGCFPPVQSILFYYQSQ